MASKALTGPYAGFTKAELLTEWDRYKAALQESGSSLAGASIGGQSFQFGPRRDWSLNTWGRNLRLALSQVDPDNWIAPTGQILTRFSDC